jgi:hypothetical protein
MADDNGNHLPDLPTRQDFPEVKDKVVEIVEITVEAHYYGITIRFRDKTALTLVIEPCVFAFPRYSDWTDGEENVIREYPPIRSDIPKS